jgi:KaiC/GvpD/RAD55 family RecA-like ATPase
MITSSLRPLTAPTPAETTWLVPNLLPAGEIVLLEGPAGVGKTLLAAAWTSRISKEGQGGLAGLVLTASTRAADLAASHLARHQADFDRLRNIHWSATSRDENGKREAVVNDMLTHFEAHLEEHKPKLLVIDALEEVLVELASEPAHWQRHFWDRLQKSARRHACTILILSRPCTRRDRAGRVGRLAADYARCCFSLAWHPTDAAQRVLTRTRDPLAAAGAQWHVGIDGDGHAECFTAPDNDHVPPGQGSAPVTWLSRRQKSDNIPRILKALEEYVGIKLAAFQVRDHILGQGFSYSAFREALRHSDITHKREGGVWWYVPGPDHVARNRAIHLKKAVPTSVSGVPSSSGLSCDEQARRSTADSTAVEAPRPNVEHIEALRANSRARAEAIMQRFARKLDGIVAKLNPADAAALEAGDPQVFIAVLDAHMHTFDPEERLAAEKIKKRVQGTAVPTAT